MAVCSYLERVRRASSSSWLGEETEREVREEVREVREEVREVREDTQRREERGSNILRLAIEQSWPGNWVDTGSQVAQVQRPRAEPLLE